MEFVRKLTALFYPERCPYCSALIEATQIACARCYDEIRRKHIPIPAGARGFRCISTFAYDCRVRRMILRLKYHDRTQYIPQIAELLRKDIQNAYSGEEFDFITAVPMYKNDLKKRGYNQSTLLAKELGKRLGLPYLDTIDKIKKTKKQHHLKYQERKTNLNGAFKVIDKDAVTGKKILIIDDIITSGYTLGNCCRVLSRAKPELICCATIASAQNKYPESTVI